jgi:pectin lyase
VTIPNDDFNGVTSWSSGCNSKNYWTVLLVGLDGQYTFAYNHLHDASGRASHYGTTTTAMTIFFHGFNDCSEGRWGHAFDIDQNTYSLFEGNYHRTVTTSFTSTALTASGHICNVVTVDEAGTDTSYTGCIYKGIKAYMLGSLPDLSISQALSKATLYKSCLVDLMSVSDVPADVIANAVAGKI